MSRNMLHNNGSKMGNLKLKSAIFVFVYANEATT